MDLRFHTRALCFLPAPVALGGKRSLRTRLLQAAGVQGTGGLLQQNGPPHLTSFRSLQYHKKDPGLQIRSPENKALRSGRKPPLKENHCPPPRHIVHRQFNR